MADPDKKTKTGDKPKRPAKGEALMFGSPDDMDAVLDLADDADENEEGAGPQNADAGLTFDTSAADLVKSRGASASKAAAELEAPKAPAKAAPVVNPGVSESADGKGERLRANLERKTAEAHAKVQALPDEFDGSAKDGGLVGENAEKIVATAYGEAFDALVKSHLHMAAEHQAARRESAAIIAQQQEIIKAFITGGENFSAGSKKIVAAVTKLSGALTEQNKEILVAAIGGRKSSEHAAVRMDNLATSQQGLKSAMEDLANKKFSGMADVFSKGIEALTGRAASDSLMRYGVISITALACTGFGYCLYHWAVN